MQEIRHAYPEKPLTIVHNLPHVLNPTSKTPDPTGGHFSYSSPPTAMKLSNNLESELKALDVKLILNDRVEVPTSSTGPKEWDGSFGLQTGPKTVSLKIWEEGRGGLRVHCGWEQAERLACREGGPRGDRGWSHCRRRVSPGESWHPGSGTLQFPLIGTVTTPRFMVKSVKGQKLFTDQLVYGRFKGAEKFEGHPIPAIAA